MSRDEGFLIADIDVGLLRDVKVRRLRQHVPADDISATTLVYLAVVLSSWEEGHRLSVDEADSPIEATSERVAALRAVELLDADGKVPLRAWESWFRPAWERREKKRRGGVEGNRRRWHPDSESESESESDSASPSGPSVPFRPPVPRGGSKEPRPGTGELADPRPPLRELVAGTLPWERKATEMPS